MTHPFTLPALSQSPHVLARRMKQASDNCDFKEKASLKLSLQYILNHGDRSDPRLVRSVKASVRWSSLDDVAGLLVNGWEVSPVAFVRLLRWQGIPHPSRTTTQAIANNIANCNIRITMKLEDTSASVKEALSLLDRQLTLVQGWCPQQRQAYWDKCLRVVENRHLVPHKGCVPFAEGSVVEAVLDLGALPGPNTLQVVLGVDGLSWPRHERLLEWVHAHHPEAVLDLDPEALLLLGGPVRAWLQQRRLEGRLESVSKSCRSMRL